MGFISGFIVGFVFCFFVRWSQSSSKPTSLSLRDSLKGPVYDYEVAENKKNKTPDWF